MNRNCKKIFYERISLFNKPCNCVDNRRKIIATTRPTRPIMTKPKKCSLIPEQKSSLEKE
jgi:hypothetical protein